ncbi:MAG: hypothetical protein WC967_13615 [Balneolaceae bacterium]
MTFEEIVLGNTYKDTLTGFEGKATGKVLYLEEQSKVCLEQTTDEDSGGYRWCHIFTVEAIEATEV